MSASLLWFFGLQLIGLAAYSIFARPTTHSVLALALSFGAAMGLCVVWGGLDLALVGVTVVTLVVFAVSAFFTFVVEPGAARTEIVPAVRVGAVLLAGMQMLVGFGAAEDQLRAAPGTVQGVMGGEASKIALAAGAAGLIVMALIFGLLALLWRPTRSADLRVILARLQSRMRSVLMPLRGPAAVRSGARIKHKGGRRDGKR